MSSLDMMQHCVNIQRVTQTNTDGVIVPVWADHATSQALIQEGSGSLRNSPGSQGLVYDAICFLPPWTDIKPQGKDDNNDRVIVIQPSRLAGVTYLVKLAVDESGMQDHIVAYLTRVPSP